MFQFIGEIITYVYEMLCQGFNLINLNKFKNVLNELNSYSFNIKKKDILIQICIQVNHFIFIILLKICVTML